MNKKSFIKISSFIIFVFLTLIIFSSTLFSPLNVTKIDSSLTSAYSFANEPENSIQIVGIGNSDLSSGLIPNIIWEKCGYTSNIAAGARQTPEKSYKKLVKILKTQNPNLVIVETDMLYEESIKNNSGASGVIDKAFAVMNTNDFNVSMEDHFTVFKFHDVWKNLGSNDESSNADLFAHGYRYKTEKNGITIKDFMKKSDDVEPISDIDIEYITKIVNLCKKKNIDVLFLEIPSPCSWNYSRHNAVSSLAESMNVEFVDTSLLVKEIGIDMSNDYRDVGNHLNYYGATKLTNYICDYINKNYKYENRLNNLDYSYWQESCDEFRKRIK